MKKTQALILLTSLAASSAVLAVPGASPHCKSGPLNLVIYNKDLTSDDCSSPDGKGKYCIYDQFINGQPWAGLSCNDDDGPTWVNTSESVSFRNTPKTAYIMHYLYTKNGKEQQELRFTYENGSVSDNCDQVFGSDVKCVITELSDSNHQTYILTISKK